MYREESWAEGHYMDNQVKYECSDCDKTFIIGEEMKKDCPPGYPICPYCGQKNVNWTVWTTDENLKEMHENGIGCSGLYIDRLENSSNLNFQSMKCKGCACENCTDACTFCVICYRAEYAEEDWDDYYNDECERPND